MDQSKDNLKSANPIVGLPGAVFEKAWELRWALKLAYVCLFLDSLLAFVLHQNLLGLSGNMAMLWEHLGAIFVGITAFCLTVSLAIPAMARFVCLAGVYLPWQLFEGHVCYDIHHGHVTHSALRKHSLRQGDEFTWKLWESADSARTEERIHRFLSGELVFGLAVFGVVNALVGVRANVETLMLSLNSIIGVSGWAIVGVVLISVLYWAWWAAEGIAQIYHPPLYEELCAKEASLDKPRAKCLDD